MYPPACSLQLGDLNVNNLKLIKLACKKKTIKKQFIFHNALHFIYTNKTPITKELLS